MKKRKPGLTVIIILLGLSNIAGLFKLNLNTKMFAEIYSLFSLDTVRWLSVIPLTTLIALWGIWCGKRWGLWIVGLVYIITMILDLSYKVWPHAILATVFFFFLALFCWQSRQYFIKND